MTNATCVLLYTPLILATTILLIATIGKDRSQYFVRRCITLYATMLGWQICEALFFVAPTPEAMRYIFDIKLVFVAFMPVVTFFVYISFYRLQRLLPKWLPVLLYALPVITALLAVLSPLHSLLSARFVVLAQSPTVAYISVRGAWYYVLFGYSFLLVVSMLVLVYIHYKNLPQSYREGSQIMSLALMFSLVGMVVETFRLTGIPLDSNLIGASLGGILFYIATLVNNRMDYLHIKRREVFEYLDEPVFILSDRDMVVDANPPARRLLSLLGVSMKHTLAYGALLDALDNEHKIRRMPTELEHTEDLYVLGAGFPLVYRVRRQVIAPAAALPTGMLVLFQDITNNALFMERLREMAGVDQLTGLPNRFGYQQALRELDVPEKLPLSILMGDLDGLKIINDTHGHHAGDHLLKMAAKTMLTCCPAGGIVARIGGDEFAILMPGYSREAARDVAESIQACIAAQQSEEAYPLRIALGVATKEDAAENINALIARADRDMYDNKR